MKIKIGLKTQLDCIVDRVASNIEPEATGAHDIDRAINDNFE